MSGGSVDVNGVWKQFRLGKAHESLGDWIAGRMASLLGRGRPAAPRERFWALRDITFSVARGEAFGIIGPNGAGKSTMLKLLAGIFRADKGQMAVPGRLAALIEVGAGFHGDLTGRENVFLNGAILGMNRVEIKSKLDSIVAFAGIERFLDMPVKRYSSGMYARLGFSIAAHVDPEVLLVDEVLSVGDAVFRLRCMEKMSELIRAGTTIIFVTHNLEQMQMICENALVLDAGAVVFRGASRDAIAHYLKAMTHAPTVLRTDVVSEGSGGCEAVALRGLCFLNDQGQSVVTLASSDAVRAQISFDLQRPVSQLVVELNMRASTHENILSFNSGRDGRHFQGRRGLQTVTLELPLLPVAGGQYFWTVRMWDAVSGETILDSPMSFPVVVDDAGRATGRFVLDHTWNHSTSHDPSSAKDRDALMDHGAPAEGSRENLLLR